MGVRTNEFESSFGAFCKIIKMFSCFKLYSYNTIRSFWQWDVGPDEVIIPALTFIADCNSVKMVGAKPVLADSTSADDWNVSAESIESCITTRTKSSLCTTLGFLATCPRLFGFAEIKISK